MAFVKEKGNVVAFAEFSDLESADNLVIVSNTVLDDSSVIDPQLRKATDRILSKLRSSDWWKSYFTRRDTSIRRVADIPALNPNLILARQSDFTDLCLSTALAEFILPMVADFGSEDNAERKKMDYYATRAEDLFKELVEAGDWYDFDASGIITSDEKEATVVNNVRVR